MIRLAAIALCVTASASQAQMPSNCDTRKTIVDLLNKKYGETQQSMGLAKGNVVEMFASTKTGSWTITITLPDGMMCLLASGKHFEILSKDQAQGSPL